ncbi:MAG: CHAD domain-containing protein [Proteobacteria bacterium]|nr:CHAD domain-containing protein [Pseudomonadota bacterium]
MMAPADDPKPLAGGPEDPSPAPVRVDDRSTARALACGDLRTQLTVWAQREPGVRLGTDPDELHQLRVAARRIDAILGLFKKQLPEHLVRRRKRAKTLARALGAARDYDVQLAELERYCTKLTAAERTAAAPLYERLESDRAQARGRMLRALDSGATREWLGALQAALDEPAGTTGTEPAATVMPKRVRKRFRKLRKAIRGIGAKSGPEDFHVVRRRAKGLRYALEPGTSLYGKAAEDLLKALRQMQDRLGAHQDAQAARQRLEALSTDAHKPLPPATLFLMGRMAEHQLRLTDGARKTLARAWNKVGGKRWRALRARMDELSGEAEKATAAAPVAADIPPAAENHAPAPTGDVQAVRH